MDKDEKSFDELMDEAKEDLEENGWAMLDIGAMFAAAEKKAEGS